jgi:hypothetical protein
MKAGMIAEVTCISKPFTIIPMVVSDVQDYIAAGQFRGGEQLVEAQQVSKPARFSPFWSLCTKAASTASLRAAAVSPMLIPTITIQSSRRTPAH